MSRVLAARARRGGGDRRWRCVVAKLVDWRIARRDLPPEAATRYRVLRRIDRRGDRLRRRALGAARDPAGARGRRRRARVVGGDRARVGFASQRTIGNFVAGLLIAFTQPLRLGDEVEVAGRAAASSRRSGSPTPGSAPATTTGSSSRTRSSPRRRSATRRSAAASTVAEVTVAGAAGRRPAARWSRRSSRRRRGVRQRPAGDRRRSSCATWVDRRRLGERAASDLRLAVADRLARSSTRVRSRRRARRPRLHPRAARRASGSAQSADQAPPPRRRDRRGLAGSRSWSSLADASASAPAPRSRQAATSAACRPVEIGQNSFVYARDGSLLGVDPGRAEPRAGRRCAA